MLLLKKRHLMPGYGLKQPYMPEHGPYMLFDEVPDIVIMGDLHNNSYGYYRGTTFINNGTWQKQTPYQIKLGHVPTPGTATLMELKTGKITETKFQQVE
jgi:DNA polymerase II small subunit